MCISIYNAARSALSLGSPTLQGLLHVLPENALPGGLACNVTRFPSVSSVFKLSSSLSPLLSRSTFAATLVRTCRSKQALPAGCCVFQEQDRVDACPQGVRLYWLAMLPCLRLPGQLRLRWENLLRSFKN